jgi:Spy/CpxP family protein refolding chaperone
MIRSFVLFVLAALSLTVQPLGAQPRPGFMPWWDMPVARDLNLREDQQKQIREITREYRSKLIDLRAAVDKSEIALSELFEDDNFDVNRAMAASDRLANSRAELSKAFSQMNVRLRAVLTGEQWRELQRRMPMGGPGGPGGGPRGGPEGKGRGRHGVPGGGPGGPGGLPEEN